MCFLKTISPDHLSVQGDTAPKASPSAFEAKGFFGDNSQNVSKPHQILEDSTFFQPQNYHPLWRLLGQIMENSKRLMKLQQVILLLFRVATDRP
jgi:hypothetical protein